MRRLAPLVIRLTAMSLVALAVAENGGGHDTAVTQATPTPARAPPPSPRPRPERRQRNRRRTTTTTTTTPEPDEDEEDHTTPMATTTVDPRTFDHSKSITNTKAL